MHAWRRMLTVKRRVRSAPCSPPYCELRAVGADSLLHHYLPGHRHDFPNRLLLIFGMLSVAVAAFSFWYSGTLSVCWRTPAWRTGTGRGGARHWRAAGNFCCAAYTLNHSLAKTLLFCGSGNVRSSTARAISTSSAECSKSCHYRRAVWRRCAGAGRDAALQHFLSEFMTVTAGLARNHLLITSCCYCC